MKNLRFQLNIRLTDGDTDEVLVTHNLDSSGSTQAVAHATKGIAQAVAYAFEVANSHRLQEKQKDKEPLK